MAIKVIDIVCHTHTDFCYTDHSLVARELLKRYVGEAVEWANRYASFPEEAQFHWTLEALAPVWDWWQEASDAERQALLAAVDRGQIEVTGLAFNITAFLNEEEWDHILKWIPPELWERFRIRGAMQNDINGLHTGGVSKIYDAGIKRMWIGPNTYNGAPPVPTPALIDWHLDEARTLRVWLNASYCDAYYMFQENWRQGPVPAADDLRYRKPERGDFFRSDEPSVRKAHETLLRNVAAIEGKPGDGGNAARDGFTQNKVFGGYTGEVLAVSFTNQWRLDNDPPYPWISDFVLAWNRMGLQPRLRLRTMSQAMEDVAAGWQGAPKALYGEWPDWWANGTASSPVELSYNRRAKRLLRLAGASVFGPWDAVAKDRARDVLNDMCLYDEHSFGSWKSVAYPDSFEAKSQLAEKNIWAYRALAGAERLLSQRALPLADGLRNAIKVINPTSRDRDFVIRLPRNTLRGDYAGFVDTRTGERRSFTLEPGVSSFMRPASEADFGDENMARTFSDSAPDQTVRFRVNVPAMGEAVLALSPEGMKDAGKEGGALPELRVETDGKGWPVQLSLGDQVLVMGAAGEFIAAEADGFSPRWTFRDIFDTEDEAERRRLYQAHIHLSNAEYGPTICRNEDDVVTYEQPFSHPLLAYGKRILTVDRGDRTVSFTVRFYRKSNLAPALYYIRIDSPIQNGRTHISNAGKPFRPNVDQIEGSCRDYYALDGWVHCENAEGSWLVSSRDAALVAFGAPSQPSRIQSPLPENHRVFFQVFDNTWDTNFNPNAFGMMEFTFDLATGVALEDSARTSLDLAAEPVVIVRTGY